MRCLFIGGLNAGRMIEVDIERERIMLSEPLTELSSISPYRNCAEMADRFVRTSVYHRHQIIDKHGARYFLYADADIDDPLIELMDFYARNSNCAPS